MPNLRRCVPTSGTGISRCRWLCLFGWLFLACGLSAAKADTVTLNSGEVLEGRILSETDTQLVIEASYYHGTILSSRELLKSEIRSIVRESLEQKQEKADYAALSAYALNPDQELTKGQYDMGIAAFEKFLTIHTNSSLGADVNQRLVDWRTEASNVASGRVKFAGTWMTPEQKKVQAAQASLQSLQKQLADVQRQRAAQTENLATIQKQLAVAQSRLTNIGDSGGSGSAANQGGRRDLAGRLTAGVVGVSQGENMGEPVSNPERSQVQAEISSYQQQVTQGNGTLTLLDAKIADLQSQIPPREQEYKTALARVSGTNNQSQAGVVQVPPARAARPSDTNAPAKAAQPSPPPQDQNLPWYTRAWKWFHG